MKQPELFMIEEEVSKPVFQKFAQCPWILWDLWIKDHWVRAVDHLGKLWIYHHAPRAKSHGYSLDGVMVRIDETPRNTDPLKVAELVVTGEASLVWENRGPA